MTDLSRLIEIVGETNVLNDDDARQNYGRDWTRFYDPAPQAIVFVRDADQIVELVRFANESKIGLVPSGGRTGLSGGACATAGEIVVSFDKMNRILDFDPVEATVVVEPGVVTARLQEYAAQQGLYYPVDFASSGSSQIGGNISTNAGGIRVLRYGLTRDWVTGLKVVTGKGDLLDLNRGLTKNATGYDLRHLFIGSEGTLGFVVEATIRLESTPPPGSVMLLATPRMEDCLAIMGAFEAEVQLSAFEFFSEGALTHVLAHSDLSRPFNDAAAYYVLIEFDHPNEEALEAASSAFTQCIEAGWAVDGVISSSARQNEELWQYRERISESITPRTPYKNDVSVRVSQVPGFLAAIDEVVSREYPDFEIVWFGHIGDGNLHLNILKPEDWETDRFKDECQVVSEKVLAAVESFGGSISAEHGVGLLKRDQLHFSRSDEEIIAMKAIKKVFDPNGIMNPGKLI